MSQYSHLSELDPELSAFLKEHPPQAFPRPDDVAALQKWWITHAQPRAAAYDKGRLPPDANYRVQDYKVPVEGGEITVRAVIPGTGDEGQQYPFLFWTHGGGLIFGDVDQDDFFLRNISTELQVTTLNVDYRVAPGHLFPVQLNDSFAALKWAIANTDTLSISLEKGFIIGGCSAGGTLAAGLTIRVRDDPFFRDTPITGQYLSCPLLVHIDAYSNRASFPNELLSAEQNKDVPVLTKEMIIWTFKTIGGSSTDPELSPVLATSHVGLPPTFFQICGLDPLRDDAFLYDRILREAGCKTHVNVYPGLPHVFYVEYPSLQSSEKYQSDIRIGLRWLLNKGENTPHQSSL
ncbi:Alpha/Beta hydrolase protein [Multifurca ochricompacta]|uniref:Alpha/Beta hydrolase protein n=1 Tax=Multifurca ochricompacta TaxID=376703 RepID=A0AAD4M5X2_9AGAM|nr:Alpha/Beta hydrolase protein [Multifurca ochricompacta]